MSGGRRRCVPLVSGGSWRECADDGGDGLGLFEVDGDKDSSGSDESADEPELERIPYAVLFV